ncbi:MAG: glycosyltransferase [Coriobacteriales bacterium]|jgi:glycosyltransferase involved in cell wall biosynthesis|nr:glycosyltransferase [Coriobacteriales bacterium]
MSSDFKFAALIPAYNEADVIGQTLASCFTIAGLAGIIVANDGSRDTTEDIAVRSGAFVCGFERRLGKGAALELAARTLEQVRPFGNLDAVLLLDADLGSSAANAAALLEPLRAGRADMTVALLPSPTKKAGFGLVKGLAAEGIATFGGGFQARAPLSGQRALTIDCLNRVRPFARGFAVEVDMTLKALRQKQSVVEVPLDLGHREYGRNLRGFLHRGRQFWDIYQLLNSYRKAKALPV